MVCTFIPTHPNTHLPLPTPVSRLSAINSANRKSANLRTLKLSHLRIFSKCGTLRICDLRTQSFFICSIVSCGFVICGPKLFLRTEIFRKSANFFSLTYSIYCSYSYFFKIKYCGRQQNGELRVRVYYISAHV